MAAIIGLKRTADLVTWMSSQFLVWRNNDRYPERTVVPIGVNDITWTLGPIYENSCICMCLACSTPITISNSIALARQFSNIVRHFTETRTCSASKVFYQPKKFKSTDSQMLTPVIIMNSKCDQHSSVISQALPRVTMLNSPLVSPVTSPSASRSQTPTSRVRTIASRSSRQICMHLMFKLIFVCLFD